MEISFMVRPVVFGKARITWYSGSSKQHCEERMRFSGFLLLVSGVAIAVAALALLKEPSRGLFLLAAIGMQVAGLTFVALSHRPRGGNGL
jgi:cobalamin biosynthesis protein CobD/CbiB